MPLFMDFHKEVVATMEEVVKAHVSDLVTQEKFGVKYHKYWMNLEAGTVYCLIEGPDKESCEAVHQLTHGKTACAIVEVDPNFFKLFMGNGHFLDNGPMLNPKNIIDLGYRNILAITTYCTIKKRNEIQELIRPAIAKQNGREARWPLRQMHIYIFDSTIEAISCANEIQLVAKGSQSLRLKIGLSAGQPVTENDEFFGAAIKLAHRLSLLANDGQILISSLAKRLCSEKELFILESDKSLKFFDDDHEDFLTRWFDATDESVSDENLTLDKVCNQLAISRPQLYRKIVHIADRSPNELLQDQRMDIAFAMLKNRSNNISQIALNVGYTSPSYFAKLFTNKYGITPSKLMIS